MMDIYAGENRSENLATGSKIYGYTSCKEDQLS